jgi:hypothetical protein
VRAVCGLRSASFAKSFETACQSVSGAFNGVGETEDKDVEACGARDRFFADDWRCRFAWNGITKGKCRASFTTSGGVRQGCTDVYLCEELRERQLQALLDDGEERTGAQVAHRLREILDLREQPLLDAGAFGDGLLRPRRAIGRRAVPLLPNGHNVLANALQFHAPSI